MKAFVTVVKTIVALAILECLAVVAFIYSGVYDVSATAPDNAIVAWAVHTVSEASVAARLGANKVPAGLDKPETIKAGGRLFVENCAVCHGAPEVAPTPIAQGLNPSPPNLFAATREPDEKENFQFIKYGVKMTAMPGFGKSQDDDHIWQTVAFLNKLPGMSKSDYAALTAAVAPAAN
ncbi:MAG: cytochrome c [Ancalomicrobiaceae bacterium]|nr:cytochrome c [Ancalomicrobiaceae bacterium]